MEDITLPQLGHPKTPITNKGPSVFLKFHIVDKTGADNTAFFNRLLYLKDNRPSTHSLILNDVNVFSIEADSVIVQETPVVISWNIGVIPSGIGVNDILRLRLEPTHVIASSTTKGTSNLNENIAVGEVRVRYGNAISTLFGSNTCNFGLSHSIPETSVQGNVTRANVFGNYVTMPSVETTDINTMGHNVTFQFDVTKCANVGSTNTIIHDDCTLIGNGITTTTAGTLHLNTPFATGGAIAGTEFPVPALPAQWLTIVVNGTKLLIPAYLPTP